MKNSWLAPNKMINRWIATDDILYCRDTTGTWAPMLDTTNIWLDYCKQDIEITDGIFNHIIKKEDDKMNTNKTNHYCFPVIEKVIVNGPATIVYFDDKDRVIVKRMGIDKNDLFSAVAQAYCKKVFGSTSAFHREVLNKLVVQEPKKAKKKNDN